MFRFLNTFTLFNLSSAKYIIKNKKYLIDAPPAKPSNAWALFTKEQTTGLSGMKMAEKMAELSKKWAQNPQIKEKYGNQASIDKNQYQRLLKAYEKKYPMKMVTFVSLSTSKFYENGVNIVKEGNQAMKIEDYAKLSSEKIKKISVDDKCDLMNEAKNIRDANKALLSQYQFPQKKYLSPAQLVKSNAELYKKAKVPIQEAYKIWEDSWRQSVAKWLQAKGYDLSIQNFMDLYKKSLEEKEEDDLKKKLKKQKDAQFEQIMKVWNSKNENKVNNIEKKDDVVAQ